MTIFNIETTTPATLSEKELFAQFLDAPIRVGAASTLLAPKEGEYITRDHFFLFHGFDAVCIPDELADQILEELEASDEPAYDLDYAISDLECLLNQMKVARREFDTLCEATRTEAPDEDATAEQHRDWNDNPRYVLPIIPTDGIKRLATDITAPNAQ